MSTLRTAPAVRTDALELPLRNFSLEARLRDASGGLRIGAPCYAFQQVASTMDLAHQIAEVGALEGACVWAESQTAGRGRAGRQWISPQGGFYLSLILRPTRAPAQVPQLSLVAGLAAAQAIKEATGLLPSIRWPNDVLLNGKKLAGILIESRSSSRHVHHVIVGIGVNVTADAAALPDIATSLDQWVDSVPDRITLAVTFFKYFQQAYYEWKLLGFPAMQEELVRWLSGLGRQVRITTARKGYEGEAMGVDASGRLLVRVGRAVQAFAAGEVSLLQ